MGATVTEEFFNSSAKQSSVVPYLCPPKHGIKVPPKMLQPCSSVKDLPHVSINLVEYSISAMNEGKLAQDQVKTFKVNMLKYQRRDCWIEADGKKPGTKKPGTLVCGPPIDCHGIDKHQKNTIPGGYFCSFNGLLFDHLEPASYLRELGHRMGGIDWYCKADAKSYLLFPKKSAAKEFWVLAMALQGSQTMWRKRLYENKIKKADKLGTLDKGLTYRLLVWNKKPSSNLPVVYIDCGRMVLVVPDGNKGGAKDRWWGEWEDRMNVVYKKNNRKTHIFLSNINPELTEYCL